MKKTIGIRYLIGLTVIALTAILHSCQDDDYDFGEVTAPTNLTLEATVLHTSEENPYGDGSGMVEFTAHADNAISYKYNFGDNTTEVDADGEITHAYTNTGTHDYTVTVTANGPGGISSTTSTTITVFSAFDDPETRELLTGGLEEGSSKTWYVAAALPAHLGVGPVDGTDPAYYSAAPFEKEEVNGEEGCLYDDAMTFTLTESGQILFEHENNGVTFFNASYNSVGGGGGSDDQCLPYDTTGEKNVSLSAINSEVPEDETTGTQFTISEGGFMSYYLNTSSYEVLEITEDYMHVRAKMGPGGDPLLAWYLKFTTDPDGGTGSGGGEPLETHFPGDETNAFWSQEFNDGSLDTDIWNYEIGNNNGWGNQELQYYTDENVTVENGSLFINLIAEDIEGFDYSSSRITTEGNFEFQYGRVEVRAKLPEGGGVWPAIWMLGSNFSTVGWPETGEIDIMEHNGNVPTVVSSALHFPGNSGGDAIHAETNVEDVSSTFHTYTLEWREDAIIFAVDNIIYHEFTDMEGTAFQDHSFFLILNIAMGGTFVDNQVDPDFQQSAMEIDYIRVYTEQ